MNCKYSEKIYQFALTKTEHIGNVHAKILVDHFRTATAIFSASFRELVSISGIGEIRARNIRRFKDFSACENLHARVEKLGIRTFFLGEADYPSRLLNCEDPPTILYGRGNTQLNKQRLVAVIGTRNHTEYGRTQTEKFIRELSGQNITIISGMAYGIDGLAHRAALKYGLPTIGILAHGLDLIYPPEHKSLARDILQQNGGFLSEYPPGTQPEKHHFPVRNRIVAGISDAVVVVETGVKGGSMITAGCAFDYGTDLFAFPGRVTDPKSCGCNQLIRSNKAILLTDSVAFMAEKDWMFKKSTVQQAYMDLPLHLNADETNIINMLQGRASLTIDELYAMCGLSAGTAAAVILSLELQNLIEALPGKRYRLKSR